MELLLIMIDQIPEVEEVMDGLVFRQKSRSPPPFGRYLLRFLAFTSFLAHALSCGLEELFRPVHEALSSSLSHETQPCLSFAPLCCSLVPPGGGFCSSAPLMGSRSARGGWFFGGWVPLAPPGGWFDALTPLCGSPAPPCGWCQWRTSLAIRLSSPDWKSASLMELLALMMSSSPLPEPGSSEGGSWRTCAM